MRDTPDSETDGLSGSRAGWHSGRPVSRRRALATLASAGSLALAGCSLASSLSGVDPVWEQDLPDAAGAGPPAGTDEYVVVGGQDRHIHGFSADGERRIDIETGGPVEARPAVPGTGGPVHVHSTDGDLYTVATSGEQLWHVEGQARSGWVGRHGSLIVAIDPIAGTVSGYDAQEGTRRFRRPSPDYPYPVLTETVCLLHGTAPDGSRRLVAVNPETGDVRWDRSPDEGYLNPIAAGDRIATVRESTVRWHRAGDGTVLWRQAVDGEVASGFAPPIWVGDDIYVRVEHRDSADELVALSRDNGTPRWRRPVGYELEMVDPSGAGVVAASSVNDPDGGILIRLDAFDGDGTKRWQTTTDISIGGTVEALGHAGEIVFAASDNEIAAYDPADGSRRWHYEPDNSRIGVAAADDALYVSYRDSGGVARLPTS
ncbi:outer membrane protein assembly factor BamB family protein [Halosimplex marinum]|uniref:outer membrane protein assembly factor BamB family protein n=1 Tax=Halosimplex marinum TaxID=3396620 RepID=UPI003F556FD3